jgi:hypothetical protein
MKFNFIYARTKDLVPTFSEVRPYLKKAFKEAQGLGIKVKFFGFPLCVLGDFWRNAKELDLAEEVIVGVRNKKGSYIRKKLGKEKPGICLSCGMYAQCEGAWKPYFRLYGEREFREYLRGSTEVEDSNANSKKRVYTVTGIR